MDNSFKLYLKWKNGKYVILTIAFLSFIGFIAQYLTVNKEVYWTISPKNLGERAVESIATSTPKAVTQSARRQNKGEITDTEDKKPIEKSINMSPDMQKISRERNLHLKATCEKLGYGYSNGTLNVSRWTPKPVLSRPRLFYSDKHKVVICGVPKCGSTEWRKALLIVEGDVNTNLPSEIEHEYAFTRARQKRFLWERFKGRTPKDFEEMNERLNNYYRIMTVREPLERVVSAYIDKMLPGGSGVGFYGSISNNIHRKFAPNRETKDFKPGPATFEEFVDSIINNPKGLDIHWMLYSDICDPCHMKYDYIAKLETIALDSLYVSNITGIDNKLLFPDNSNTTHTLEHKWKNKYSVYLEKIPLKKLHALYQVYWEQYKLFNYSPPPVF